MTDAWPNKDPDAHKDYSVDWSSRLQDGETIITSTWTADSADLTITDGGISGGVTTVWLSGGVVGVKYSVTNRITTSRGVIDDKTTTIKIAQQ